MRTSTSPSDQQSTSQCTPAFINKTISNTTMTPIKITPIILQDLKNGTTAPAMNQTKTHLTQTLTRTTRVTTSTSITQRNKQKECPPYSSTSVAPEHSHPHNVNVSNISHLS